VRFGVLGPLAVWTGDGRQISVPEAKVRLLLTYLLLREGQPVSADRLIEALWGDRLPGNPRNTLQTKVFQLRKVLEQAEPGGGKLVTYQLGGYAMPVDLDVTQFRAVVARARDSDDVRVRSGLLADALALWRGPVLGEVADEPFARPVIARLEEERLAAQEDWAEARLELGDHDVLTGDLAELVSVHPMRERLRALQMRALYRAGRQAEALDSYRELRRLLADELGLTPGPDIAAVQQAILEQDPTLAIPSASRTNLPEPLTELVGRDDAVQSVLSLLSGTRLVTLTGPGGVGKTRLALQTARQLPNAWLIELSGLDRHGGAEQCPPEELIVDVFAATLRIRDERGCDANRLAEYLRDRDIALVLDNCEGVVEPVAGLAAKLLEAAPGLRILATSQLPLGVVGEVVWNVPPLSVPGAGSVAVEDVLETVVAYGLERLGEAGEREAMQRSHADYYVGLAERAAAALRTREQCAWLEPLCLEAPNLRRAMETAIGLGDADLALRLVNAMAWYWFLRGRIGEARRSIRQALAVPGGTEELRNIARCWDTGLAIAAGDIVNDDAFDIAERIDHPADRATALWFLGYVTTSVGMAQGLHLAARALSEFESLDDKWGIGVALIDRASHHMSSGDFVASERDATRGSALLDELGERWGQLQASYITGSLAEVAGDYERAERIHRNGLSMAEELELAPEISFQLSWLGRIAMLRGQHQRAWQLHERARALGAEQGFKPAEMYAETGLGLVRGEPGNSTSPRSTCATCWIGIGRSDSRPAPHSPWPSWASSPNIGVTTSPRTGYSSRATSSPATAETRAQSRSRWRVSPAPRLLQADTSTARDCSARRRACGSRSAARYRSVSVTTSTGSPTRWKASWGRRRSRSISAAAPTRRSTTSSNELGYQDSNLEWLNQNQLCCQLHHTPLAAYNRRSQATFGSRTRRATATACCIGPTCRLPKIRGCLLTPPSPQPRHGPGRRVADAGCDRGPAAPVTRTAAG
jgi:DNA-binding SARP family transcriptional activator